MFHRISRARLQRSRRGVDVMVATVMLVAIVVVLAAVLFVLVEAYLGSSSTNPPLGAALALSTPAFSTGESSLISACSTTPCNFDNTSIQTASPGLQLHDLAFEVFWPNGSAFKPTGGIAALSPAGVVVGQYSFSSETWTSGGTISGQSHVTLALYTSGAAPQSLSGDSLRINGVAGYSGSITLPLS
jgi:hypothetical protein